MKPIVSFDMDMTLLNHDTFAIPESALKALDMLREHYIVVLATGRDMDSHFSANLRDQVKPDAIIHANGAKVTVGDKVIYEAFMSKELKRQLLEFAQENSLAVGVTIGDEDYYVHPECVTKHDQERWGECGRRYFDPWKLMDMKVPSMCYIGKPEGAALIGKAFPELRLPLFAGQQGADIIEEKNSKANGLRLLCKYYGTSIEEAYAFGDSMNDYEIIKAAGTGIAMGNANPKLKEVADYVASDINDDGIYKACVELGLIKGSSIL